MDNQPKKPKKQKKVRTKYRADKKNPFKVQKKYRDYNSPEYVFWRKTVADRDDHKCQMPIGSLCCGKKGHEIHHILPWSRFKTLRFEPHNGITLCHDCHLKLKNKEMIFAPLLIQAVAKQIKLKKNDRLNRADKDKEQQA